MKNSNESQVWVCAEKAAIIITIIMGLGWIFNILKSGVKATIPAWWNLVTALIFLLIGFLIGRKFAKFKYKNLVRRIDFDYRDSPNNHHWEPYPQDGSKMISQGLSDGHFGNVMHIKLQPGSCLDFALNPAELFSKFVKFCVKLERPDSATLYCKIRVQSKNRSGSQIVWLNISVGNDVPRPVRSDPLHEWQIFISPEILDEGWLSLNINLPQHVNETYGKEGWRFNQLLGFRLRGEMTIAYIAIYK